MSKRILITGAARGIGAGTARRLAERGHRLALLGLEGEELHRVAADCGDGAIAIEVDVTDRPALGAAVMRAVEHLGGLDATMVNAGIASAAFVRSGDPEAWQRVVDVNLDGSFNTIHACVPHLVASRGYLLQVASVAAIAHAPMMSAYVASKAAVEGMADSLRTELRHHGVGVGVAYYSWIDTEMVRGADRHPAAGHMRAQLRFPFNRTYPLEDAVAATVEGIERRARIVTAPKWVRWLLPLRGLIQPAADRQALPLMPEAERLFEQELAAAGEGASAPVGAGGAAATGAKRADRAAAEAEGVRA